MASKRRQILAALKTAIDQITTANGYNNTVGLNSLRFFDISQVPADKFPCVTYITGPSAYSPLTQTDYTSGASQRGLDGWDISVVCYLKTDTMGGEGTDVIYAMEDMIEDVVKAVLADVSLGLNFVQNIYLTGTRQYFDRLDQNIGIVVVDFAVKYDFDKGAP